MPEIGTYSLSGGRRLARQRASSDPTANQATPTACQLQKPIDVLTTQLRMQLRWNHARSAAQPNASSRARGLEGKKISSPSGRGRKMSLTSPLIEQLLAQARVACSPFAGQRCNRDVSTVTA